MISIVTPSLNPGVALERNLRSLALQDAKFEHIVQDGGSRDGTRAVVERFSSTYNVRFFQEPDNGLYDAVSKGMSKAKGDILAWLGADDYYMPWTLSTVEAVFKRFPGVAWVTGIPAHGFNECRLVCVHSLAPVYLKSLIRRGYHKAGALGYLQQESMFWRRSLWDKVGGAEIIQGYRLAGDYFLWRAFAEHAPLRTVSSVLAVFSISEQQTSIKLRYRYLQETNPGVPWAKLEKWNQKAKPSASAIGKLFNQSVSVLFNRTILRPGLGFVG
jgi:glycosyltransferase involved in cell wall biosynthesis